MLFNSIHFAIFFVIIFITYFTIPHKYRWQLLLASSCYFYMVFLPVYILILGFTIVIDYFAGIYIEKNVGAKRKLFLVYSLIANIGVLAVFKYYNFLNGNISQLLNEFGYRNSIPNLSILLPVGLSFHTFQAMSYTIEVYRGNFKAEKHFGIYALYVMFFPQLVAGPIERPQNVLHQFYEKHNFDIARISSGFKKMLWGLFKKVVIADRLSIYVNSVFDNYQGHSGITLLTATIFFAVQIYCDFSGYSDIALGSAEVLGYKLLVNFKRPYFAKSIQEFWSRWHISLSTWFRDYLYIPLGGNRVSTFKWYRNLLIVFTISGLWHGANWTFIIWGALHGIYLISGIFWKKIKETIKLPLIISNSLNIIITIFLVTIAWVYFRANSVEQANTIIKNILVLKPGSLFIGIPSTFIYCVLSITVLSIAEFFQEYYENISLINHKNYIIRYATYISLALAIILFGVFNGGQFIYFQF
jgi:alginate O-acetyltransferase complex protein AlgI